MEHGQGPIWIFAHPHRDLHTMKPMWVLRDLQPLTVIMHGSVVGHDAFVLHTQDLGREPVLWATGPAGSGRHAPTGLALPPLFEGLP